MKQLAHLRRVTGVSRCIACGKCTTLCPLGTRAGFSARLIAGQELEDELHTDDVGIGRCLTCALCEIRCPEGVRFSEFVRGLRELSPGEDRFPPPHAGVFQSVPRSMTEDREPKRDTGWVGDDLKIAEEGEVALFVGCLPFFDLTFERDLGVNTLEIARAAIRILNRAGIEPVLVPQERCCGHDLLWGGDRDTFDALARANTQAFAARGVKRIVTTCAECCRTWRLDYPGIVPEYQPRVEHLAEFLAERVEAGEISFRTNGKSVLTYQDPCRLGRHLGVTDAPRRVMASLPETNLVEMERSGRDAVCCGTSGFIHCDAESRRLQVERLQEASTTGAQTLVTACPKCLIHFRCAQVESQRRERREPLIEVKDFTVLAASMLEGTGEKAQSVPATSKREAGEKR